MTNPNAVWPLELSLSPNKAILTVSFNTGDVFNLDAELLRVEAPSADVQGHGADQKQTPMANAMSQSIILNLLAIMRCG